MAFSKSPHNFVFGLECVLISHFYLRSLMSNSNPLFSIEAYFNPFLPPGGKRLDSVLTITSNSDGGASTSRSGKKLVGFIVDNSGSMSDPENKNIRGSESKLTMAKHAVRQALDLLPSDVGFFVIAGSDSASVIARADSATDSAKRDAHRLIQNIEIGGGTAISTWLDCAYTEVKSREASVVGVYLLTDGQNDDTDSKRHLERAIDRCKGLFQCDCRGLGIDWQPSDLKRIAHSLLGTADAVVKSSDMAKDFSDFLSRVISKGVGSSLLKLWSPKSVKLLTFKQVSPEILDLMPLAERIDEKTLHIPLGGWSAESRDYQMVFELPSGQVGDPEILACRPTLVLSPTEEYKCPTPVAVKWSGDDALTTRMSSQVAHFNGQGELATAIQTGLEARKAGREDEATRLLGRAVQLAHSSGNDEVTRRLKKVVDIQNPTDGTVRLRKADQGANMELEMGGARTVRLKSTTPPVGVSS
jgi:von Willebrand factor type A C-terminal domain/von Willebrand factor type A domain/Ethanolamine utilisation protein EutA